MSVDQRDIQPNESGSLEAGNGHQVYWESWGNPGGTPVVFLHGGPGGGCSPNHRRMFDPERYHVMFFDQRGCGRSTPSAMDPAADLTHNTTHHLIGDIEQLRDLMGVDRWVVLGVSWGTTLGLAYAETHPDRVSGVVLALVGLTTRREVEWITEGVARIFAPEWERFASFVPERFRDLPLVEAYARLLFDPDPQTRLEAARNWCVWEDTHMGLAPDSTARLSLEDPEFQLGFARLVTHYWSNGAFLGETELMDGAGRLKGIPGVLIHGRFDVSSPIETPWLLSKAWETAQLVVVDDAGHGGGSMTQRIRDALVQITS